MEELFGLSMQAIMYGLLTVFGVSIVSVAYIALTNRHMFKMGIRNLPRRGLQTALIVLGLMLATLIITAAFTTGDTIDHSISARSYDHWQRTDLVLDLRGDDSEDAAGADVYVSERVAAGLQERFKDDPDVELFMPVLYQEAAGSSPLTNLSEPMLHLVGADPAIMDRAGGLRNVNGGTVQLSTLAPGEVLLSERAADDLDSEAGDPLTLFVNGRSQDVTIAAVVRDEQASGTLGDFDDPLRVGGVVMPLPAAQEATGHPGRINYISVALKGDVRSTAGPEAVAAAGRIEEFLNSSEGRGLLNLQGRTISVEAVKWNDVQDAEEFGNLFTTFFLIVGLFSIAAGIMLIFMIFVMLAAERKGEMGMARAVGAQRGNLVQSFVAEGMSYNLIAGTLGAALGVAAALGLIVGFLRLSLGDDFDFISAHITARSVIISFCLGTVLTFVTVVLASMKVSSVNIVSAIRGTPEDEVPAARHRTSWLSLALGVPALIVPPLGLWLILRKGVGISWAWILGPAGILLGLFCIMLASGNGSEFLFSFGFSLLPLAAALLATHYKAPGRLTWTLVGLYLAAYWLSPWNLGEELLGRELTGDIEMFVVSGIMVVVAFTLIIVFNARLLTLFLKAEGRGAYRVPAALLALAVLSFVVGLALGDTADGLGQLFFLLAGLLAVAAGFSFAAVRFPRFGPALKMGVAYPLSNRFRTGMTIAMFSLIIFSLTTFSAVNANFEALITGEDGDGGWDVIATANTGSPVTDLRAALTEAGSPIAGDVIATGSVTTSVGGQEVRQAGDEEWTVYPVVAMNDDFLAEGTVLDSWATGYADESAVLAAVRDNPALGLLDTTAIDGFNRYDWSADVTIEDDRFEPFEVSFRDVATGDEANVTIVGVWASRLPDVLVSGVYVNREAYRDLFGAPEFDRTYIRLADGVSSRDAARGIEAALATGGVQADSIRQVIDDDSSQDRAFTRMFQAFMALGLFVGIAALGVIAFRSVVERRQQIGMLRAIGYQTDSVALTFVLESSFVALMGILSGVVGGVIVSRNLFTTGQFSGEGVEFTMPWTEVIVFVGLAFVVSLFMTWWPSRAAAEVPVAEALRYE